jgi:hypothetical protein
MLSLIACHHNVGRASDRLRVSNVSHGTSAMHALANPDNRLEFAKLVGARDFYCRHQVQQGASGTLRPWHRTLRPHRRAGRGFARLLLELSCVMQLSLAETLADVVVYPYHQDPNRFGG